MAIYGERVALLPQLLQTLWYHPQGMRFADLAHEVGRSEAEVRETLRVYHLTDLAHYLPDLVARPDVLEFLADDPEDDGDASTATKVRLGVPDPGAELGVSRIKLADVARFYRLASDALSQNPDDEVLASAVRKLRDGVLPGFRLIEAEPWFALAELRAAIKNRCLIKITYARAWEPAIGEEVIAPYGVLRTHRGWELDAAPGDERSPLRTYLLSNVRTMEVLSETFEMPTDLVELIKKHRREQVAIMEMPHAARWAVDKYAERVELVRDGPEVARLKVVLLQPYRLRAGLMLVAGGAAARVVEPVELRGAGGEVARAMLQRYPDRDTDSR